MAAESMTPDERLWAAIRLAKPDRVPVLPTLLPEPAAHLTGQSMAAIASDSERAVEAVFQVFDEYGGWDGSQRELFLLQAIPRSWLKPGNRMAVKDMATYFGGTINLELEVADDGRSVAVVADLDLAVLPIGDNFTMGPDDALRAVQLIAPQVVMPIHYNTFEVIQQDPHARAERVRNKTSAQAIVLEPGGNLRL